MIKLTLKKIPFLFGCFFLLCVSKPAFSEEILISYDNLDDIIRNRNGSVIEASLLAESAKVRTGYLQRSRALKLSTNIGTELFQTRQMALKTQPFGSLDLLWNIYRGKQDVSEESIRKLQLNSAEIKKELVFASRLKDARELYWFFIYGNEHIRYIQEALQLNQKGYNAAKRRFNSGLVTKSDLLGFELYQDVLEGKIADLVHENKIIQVQLKSSLGLLASDSLKITEPDLIHQHDEASFHSDTEIIQFGDIQELMIEKQISQYQQEKIQSQKMPIIDLFGTYALYNFRERDEKDLLGRSDIAVGLRVQVPLLDGGQNKAELDALAFTSSAISNRLAQQELDLRAKNDTAKEELIHLDEIIHRTERHLQKSKTLLLAIQGDYDRGVKDSEDLLTAIQNFMNFREAYLEQQLNYQRVKNSYLELNYFSEKKG
jgi:outer membrane protein TolC